MDTIASKQTCCIPTCGAKIEPLHKFPNPEKEPDRFRTWVNAVGGDILAHLDNKFIYDNRRICHLHFEPHYKTWNNYLIRNAVPTLQLSGFSSKERVLADVTNQQHSTLSSLPSVSVPDVGPSNQTFDLPSASSSVQRTLKTSLEMETASVITTKKRINKRRMIGLQKKYNKMLKTKATYKMRLKKALNLSENLSFQNSLKKFSTMAAIFTMLQFKMINKPKMARKFTNEEKIMALTVYKLGPKAYRWLRKIFILPSSVTISRMMARANLQPGINNNLFEQLKLRVNNMKNDDKLCSLIFDEMSLTPHLDYNRKKDKVIGFDNNTTGDNKKIADHVLVFMVRGIIKNYKQPICYSFCTGSTNKYDLARQIKEIINKLQSIGLVVLTTICDQGTANVSAINHLINETRGEYLKHDKSYNEETFEVNGEKIIPLFDVPHLLKGIRNNLITKKLRYELDGTTKTAKWDHILALYEKNPAYKGLKIMKKLSENHCNPAKIPKMKVKFASQLFSQTVGKTMGYLAENGLLPKECTHTADALLFFDNLFDSLNGSYINSSKKSGKELLRNVTPTSSHRAFWAEAQKTLKTMKFICKNGSTCTVPSITNWLRTLKNVELLCQILEKKFSINSIWCRHLNQDPLENFFGSIRSHGIRNVSPTCVAFQAAFASLLVNNMASNYSPGFNCEDDSCNIFDSFQELFFKEQAAEELQVEIDLNDFLTENLTEDFNKKKHSKTIMAILEYVAGYVLKKAKPIIKNCQNCTEELIENDHSKSLFLKCREYSQKASLTYPKEKFIKFISDIQDVCDFILTTKCHIDNLGKYIKLMLYSCVNCNFIQCPTHRDQLIEHIYNLTIRLFCFSWTRTINKLLNGTSTEINNKDKIQVQAFKYYNKRRKNKK